MRWEEVCLSMKVCEVEVKQSIVSIYYHSPQRQVADPRVSVVPSVRVLIMVCSTSAVSVNGR